ncbi:MAG: stalk domain-containing protein [Chthonomonadales bacterium]
MKRLACAFVLAGAVGVVAGSPSDARAAPFRSLQGPQLTILTPNPAEIADRFSIDVSFRGGAIQSVELYMDGALLAKRTLNTAQTHGVLSFVMDAAQLTEGNHDILVKAFGTSGKAVVAAGSLRIPAVDASAPVRIAYPQNGIQVSGVVPIRVSLDPQLQRQKPYVTFFVDKELKVLRNFPPYEYNWDTTKVENGWHVVEAWTQTQDALEPTKARPIHVNVNNATGETKKLDRIEDLRTEAPEAPKPAPAKPAKRVDPATARTGAATVVPSVEASVPAIGPAANPGLPGSTRATEPATLGFAFVTRPYMPVPSLAAPSERMPRPSARMMGGAAIQPKARLSVARGPKPVLPGLSTPEGIFPVVSPSRDGGDSLLKVQPGDTLARVSRKSGVSTGELARLNNLKPAQRLHPGTSLIVPNRGTFDVAFDGVRIAFDVQPRVEAGIALAPFRQIFEHTGGRLYWFNSQKSVRAVNSTREIEIKIGRANAVVNNETVTMEHKPFIESGRTIVPMTFIRDALNVKINYDEKSGRLLIESK